MRYCFIQCILTGWLCWGGHALGQVDTAKSGKTKEEIETETTMHTDGPLVIIYSVNAPLRSLGGGSWWDSDSLTLANGKSGNLADILREAPSLSLKRYAPGGLSSPTMRGTGAGHTQVFWEGLPMNSPMLGQQDFSLGAGSLFNSVGIRYGGNSLLLGAGGIGGGILLSSSPLSRVAKPFHLQFTQQVGSFGSVASNVGLHFTGKHFSSGTRLYFNTAKNNFPFQNEAQLGAPVQRLVNAGLLQFGGLQEFFWNADKWQLFGKVWAFQAARDLPPTMLTQDASESQSDNAVRAIVGGKHFLGRGAFNGKIGYFREQLRYRNPLAGIDAPSGFQRGVGDFSFESPSYSTKRMRFTEAGLRYVYDQAQSSGFVQTPQQNLLSAYAKGEVLLGSQRRSMVTAMLRQELYDETLSPLLGFVGFKTLGKFGLYANVARNYRYPTLNDRYWVPGGNPDLHPEKSLSAELGLNIHRQWRFDRSLSAHAGVYWTDVQNWILWLPAIGNIWQPENVQHVVARGMEMQFHLRNRLGQGTESPRYDISVHYNFNDSRDQDGYQLIYTPRHNGSARLNVQLHRWSFQYLQDWNSRRFTTADNSHAIAGYTTGDLNVGVQLGQAAGELSSGSRRADRKLYHGWHLQGGIRNIWNAQYQTVAWRPMPGRSWFVRLEVDLWKRRSAIKNE